MRAASHRVRALKRKPANQPPAKSPSSADARKAKLAAELRANLQKRKAQARARRAGEADEREGMDPKR